MAADLDHRQPSQTVNLAGLPEAPDVSAFLERTFEPHEFDLLRDLVKSAPFPAYLLDPEMTVEECSDALPELLNAGRDEIIGRPILSLLDVFSRRVPEEIRAGFLARQRRLIEEGVAGKVPDLEWVVIDNREVAEARYPGLYLVGIRPAQYRIGSNNEHLASFVFYTVLPLNPADLPLLGGKGAAPLTRDPVAEEPTGSLVTEGRMNQPKQGDTKTVSVELPGQQGAAPGAVGDRVTLEIPSSIGQVLREQAARAGETVEAYLGRLLAAEGAGALLGSAGEGEPARPPAPGEPVARQAAKEVEQGASIAVTGVEQHPRPQTDGDADPLKLPGLPPNTDDEAEGDERPWRGVFADQALPADRTPAFLQPLPLGDIPRHVPAVGLDWLRPERDDDD